jgi:AP-2 complex subunit beta-1
VPIARNLLPPTVVRVPGPGPVESHLTASADPSMSKDSDHSVETGNLLSDDIEEPSPLAPAEEDGDDEEHINVHTKPQQVTPLDPYSGLDIAFETPASSEPQSGKIKHSYRQSMAVISELGL